MSFTVAHEESQSQPLVVSSDGAYASTNSFEPVNPIVQIQKGNWGQALFSTVLWVGMLLGLFELVKLILSRVLV